MIKTIICNRVCSFLGHWVRYGLQIFCTHKNQTLDLLGDNLALYPQDKGAIPFFNLVFQLCTILSKVRPFLVLRTKISLLGRFDN